MRRAARLLCAVLLTLAPAAALAAPGALLERNPTAQITLRAGQTSPSLVTGLEQPLADGLAPVEAVRALLTDDAEFLGFDPALSTLVPMKPQTAGRFSFYRFTQQHLGLPVLGADVVATVDDKGRVRMIGDALVRLGEMPTTFVVTAEEAVTSAVQVVQPEVWPGRPKFVRRAIAGVAGDWRPVWEVKIVSAQPFGAFHVWVDAFTGEVLQAANHVFHLNKGYAYPNCPEAGAYTQVDLINLDDTTKLKGLYADLYSNCMPASMGGEGCTEADRVAKPDTNGDYLFAPAEGSLSDGFAEVHTFYHLNQMHEWYKATGFTGLDLSIPVGVNYAPYPDYWGLSCNAAYSESAIIVGLCDLSMLGMSGYVNFAYDSLSVMHEYTHGAVDHGAAVDSYSTDSWGLVAQQMGLHEGFADFFPAMVLDDPKVGRHVGPKTGEGEYFRTLTDFRSCPADIVGEPHDDGQIWGSALWEAYVATSKDPQMPLAVFEGLLALSTRPTFQDAANAVLAAAQTAHATVYPQMLAAFTAHGLLGCGREVEIASGEKVDGTLMHPQNFNLSSTTLPFEMQFKIMVPQNTSSLAFTLKGTTDEGAPTNYVRFYVQYGGNVVYKTSSMTCTAPACTVKTGSFTMTNPAPGPYYILPVGTNYGSGWGGGVSAYNFEITATLTGGDSYDGGFPWYPDGGLPGLDAAMPRDASTPRPDAAAPGLDAAVPGPDAATPGLDAAQPGLDAGSSSRDTGTVVLGPDAEVLHLPDGSTVATGDASQSAHPDASLPDSDASAVGIDAGGAATSKGCGCGTGGTSNPVASGFALMAGLAFVTSLRRRRV